MTRSRKDAFFELWLRRVLRPTLHRGRDVPTSKQLARLRRRVFAGIGAESAGRAAA